MRNASHVDVLIAHRGSPRQQLFVTEGTEEDWGTMFAELVDPLPRLARVVRGPGAAIERGAGTGRSHPMSDRSC